MGQMGWVTLGKKHFFVNSGICVLHVWVWNISVGNELEFGDFYKLLSTFFFKLTEKKINKESTLFRLIWSALALTHL